MGKTEGFRTLLKWLDQVTSEAVVGLENITEYLSGREKDEPYYHCNLEHCRDEQGKAETMKNHMLSARHKQAWLDKKTRSSFKHKIEIWKRFAESTKDFSWDFRDMKVVEDREIWMKAKEGKIRSERTAELRIKTEKYYEQEESSHSRREAINRREYEERGWRSNERVVKTEFGEFEDSKFRNDQMERVRSSPMRKEVEEVSRSGSFQNWSTATVKVDTDPSFATTSSKTVSTSTTTTTTMERSASEEIDRLHRKVANKVMKCLNKYYHAAEEFDSNHHKIGSPEEYTRLAKQFSHQLRRKIKESYEAYNSTLEGIQLTGDHEQFIRTEVESYFETVARIS